MNTARLLLCLSFSWCVSKCVCICVYACVCACLCAHMHVHVCQVCACTCVHAAAVHCSSVHPPLQQALCTHYNKLCVLQLCAPTIAASSVYTLQQTLHCSPVHPPLHVHPPLQQALCTFPPPLQQAVYPLQQALCTLPLFHPPLQQALCTHCNKLCAPPIATSSVYWRSVHPLLHEALCTHHCMCSHRCSKPCPAAAITTCWSMQLGASCTWHDNLLLHARGMTICFGFVGAPGGLLWGISIPGHIQQTECVRPCSWEPTCMWRDTFWVVSSCSGPPTQLSVVVVLATSLHTECPLVPPGCPHFSTNRSPVCCHNRV